MSKQNISKDTVIYPKFLAAYDKYVIDIKQIKSTDAILQLDLY